MCFRGRETQKMRTRVLVLEYRTHKVDNNGINANFVIPYIFEFRLLFALCDIIKLYTCELVEGD